MPATPACDSLREDHRVIDDRLDCFLRLVKRFRRRQLCGLRETLDEIRRLLAIHFQREEMILYPALRSRYPELVARMDDQHHYIRALEEHVAKMLSDIPAAPSRSWLEELRSSAIDLRDRVRHHVSDEEEQLFRAASACLRSDEQARLAERMQAVDG